MNQEGNELTKLVRQMNALSERLSLLPVTADDLMKNSLWEKYSNTVTAYISQHVQAPKYWIPNFLFRFYTNQKMSRILAFISILLDEDADGEYRNLVEPLITAGFFKYPSEKSTTENLQYYYAKWYGYFGDLQNLKAVISDPGWKEKLKKGEEYPFDSFMCFAYPLVQITNAEDINEKIVKPLLVEFSK